MVEGVSENNPNILQSSTITVNGTIDLKGTGLTGFTQDRADGSQVFLGTLNGNGTNGNSTINLAVGESYGMRGGPCSTAMTRPMATAKSTATAAWACSRPSTAQPLSNVHNRWFHEVR